MSTTDPSAPLWRPIVGEGGVVDNALLDRGRRVQVRARANFPALAGMQMKCTVDAPPVTGVLVDRALLAVSRADLDAGRYELELVIRDDAGKTHTRVVAKTDFDLVYSLDGDTP